MSTACGTNWCTSLVFVVLNDTQCMYRKVQNRTAMVLSLKVFSSPLFRVRVLSVLAKETTALTTRFVAGIG